MAGKSRFGFLLLVCGCFQRFFPILAVETNDGIAFELPEVSDGLSDKRRYELLDLTVAKRGCSSDCTVWDVVSAPGPGSTYLTGARITYGEALPGAVIRTAPRDLVPGVYTISATVQEYGAGAELVRSLDTMGDFELYRNGAGKLHARRHDRSGKKGGCQ